jgi:four helix bundle protein
MNREAGARFQVSGVRKGATVLRSFRELTVWQKSMRLATGIYHLTQGFPREETFGLASQLRRAAVSIPSNIAEGHGRSGLGQYRQFLWIARGSNFELQTQLEIAHSLKMGNPKLLKESEALSQEVGKMIYVLLEKLGSKAQARLA